MQTLKCRRKKTLKYRRKKTYKGGVGDVYSLKGKKICGERFELYFNEVFASSNYYVYALQLRTPVFVLRQLMSPRILPP